MCVVCVCEWVGVREREGGRERKREREREREREYPRNGRHQHGDYILLVLQIKCSNVTHCVVAKN